jgi:hypothetical protein
MTAQPITAVPAGTADHPSRHRHLRAAAAITGVAALIATGGYVAGTTVGTDSRPPTTAAASQAVPRVQALRDLRASVAGQYGSRPTANTTLHPSAQALREFRESAAGQYRQAHR